MKIIILCLTLVSTTALAKNQDPLRFTPHITSEAYTQKQWGVSFQRSVGANLNSNFLLSSLTLAVSDRLEIGTVPTFYFHSLHAGNLSFKYNFWRSPIYMWSLGLNSVFFDIDQSSHGFPETLKGSDVGVSVTSIQLLLNYFPKWSDLKFGVNVNAITNRLTGVSEIEEELSIEEDWEFGLDISKPFQNKVDLTLGLGWLREFGAAANEKVSFGFGLSNRWYRAEKFFSSPTLGLHYSPEIGKVGLLLSSSIY